MGTTMAFYWLKNQGLTQEDIGMGLPRLVRAADGKNRAMAQLLSGLMAFSGVEVPPELRAQLGAMAGGAAVTAGYGPAVRWVPIFEENMCEGYNASSKDARRLAEVFGVPVLACSLFDSDALMVSYFDPGEGVGRDHVATDFPEGSEIFELDGCETGCPEFLLEDCGQDKREELETLWTRRDLVFADDRMVQLCQLLGAPILYGHDKLPEGLTAITWGRS